MSKFKDRLGREWELTLTVGALGDVRRRANVDLGKLLRDEAGLVTLLFGDPVALVEVLWALVGEQGEAAGVDAESFARGFDGPACERAAEALLGAVADFFPRTRVGAALKTRMAQTLTQMDEAAVRALESNNSAGSSRASSGSTPGP